MMRKIVVIFLIAAVFASVYFIYEEWLSKKVADKSALDIPELTLWEINYVKNVHGVPVWSLKVKSAVKAESTGILRGEGVGLTVFKKGTPWAHLKAEKGEADIKKGRFRVWGHVVITAQDGNCTLMAQEMEYDEKSRRIYSNREVEFTCDDLILHGKGVVMDLNKKSIRIEGLVSALLE